MFVGYSLKNEVEQAIEKFPESMRKKLKFLLTHSSSAEQKMTIGQQHHYHQHLPQQNFSSNSFTTGVSTFNNTSSSYGSISQHPHILQQLAVAGVLNNVGVKVYFYKIILYFLLYFFL